jgi:preprotein translocase subunit SecG
MNNRKGAVIVIAMVVIFCVGSLFLAIENHYQKKALEQEDSEVHE